MANFNIMYGLILQLCWNLISADQSVKSSQPLHCYSCEGINCQRVTKINETTVCGDLLDICVTIFDGYTIVAKGCYEDLTDAQRAKCDQSDNPECFKCFSQLCNNKGRADFKCIVCDSSKQSNCANDVSNLASVQCPAPTTPNSYCYVRILDKNQIVRGCSTNLQHQLECLQDSACSLCLLQDGVACNSYEVNNTSVATRNVLNFSICTILLLLALNFN